MLRYLPWAIVRVYKHLRWCARLLVQPVVFAALPVIQRFRLCVPPSPRATVVAARNDDGGFAFRVALVGVAEWRHGESLFKWAGAGTIAPATGV